MTRGSGGRRNHGVPRVPVRTCIGCRERAEAATLLRLARGDEGELCVDEHRRMAGRGAWVHRRASCLARALEESVLNRAFRGRVHAARRAELMAAVADDR